MSAHQPNRIQSLIERRLLGPSYLGMLGGLLVRSVALVLSVAIPYATWPLLAKVLIELCAAVGMVGCADIVLSAASSSWASKSREAHALRTSSEYQASPRLSPERYKQTQAALDAKRNLAMQGIESERKRELVAILFAGAVTVSYGTLFGFTVLAAASWVTIAVEIIGVAAIPFITWYVSAQYHETTAAPEERAKALALAAVDRRLVSAQDRFADGAETPADLDLMEASTDAAPYHRKLVRALRRPAEGVRYMTTPELYQLFGATDSTAQSNIRRIVRRAGDAHLHGVIADPQTSQWLTPRHSLIDLFPHLIGNGTAAGTRRARARTSRANTATQAAENGQTGGHGPGNDRTDGEHTAPAEGSHGALGATHRVVTFPGGAGAGALAEPLR